MEAVRRDTAIARLPVDADIVAAQPLGDRARGAGAEEGIEHDRARLGRGEQDAIEQRLGFLGGMRLHAVHLHRSEEHTSELQSLMRNSYAVFCLKKKKNKI